MNDVKFSADTAFGDALKEWLDQLDQNHGDRASIRRCDSADEVTFQPAFVRFFASTLRPLVKNERGAIPRFAAIWGLSAHLKRDDSISVLMAKQSFAEQMAQSKRSGAGPRISESRFRRLLQCERAELYLPLIRVIRALDGAANAYDLARSIYYWGDSERKRWAFHYYPAVDRNK